MKSRSRDGFNLIELLVVIAILGFLAAVLIPTVGRVRECGPRSVEASNICQIGQAALIYANDNGDQLPGLNLNQQGEIEEGSATPNIHAIAAALSRYGGLDEAKIWIVREDRHPNVKHKGLSVVFEGHPMRSLASNFAESALSVQFVAGLVNGEPLPTTPIAFTRGLQPDGTWAKNRRVSVHGEDGGYIVFLGGNVSHYKEVRGQLLGPNEQPTSNILETIGSNQRIFSYPATPTGAIDGMPGIGVR